MQRKLAFSDMPQVAWLAHCIVKYGILVRAEFWGMIVAFGLGWQVLIPIKCTWEDQLQQQVLILQQEPAALQQGSWS